MPWPTPSLMSLRLDFVLRADHPDANVAALARAAGIARSTAHKWLRRHRDGLPLDDRTRRPLASPTRTPTHLEDAVLRIRDDHPAWGGRKIAAVLRRAHPDAPAPSTVTGILRRHGRLPAAAPPRDHVRFEAAAPNELWQMDFKGDFLLGDRTRCYPLTICDDHSRFALVLAACADQRRATVAGHLTAAFEAHGLPARILCDNGPPWGCAWEEDGLGRWRPRCTRLAAWLIRRGVGVVHGRPYHPQTQGKEERFHRTLREEVLDAYGGGGGFADRAACQAALDAWRGVYNSERPHEALALAVPAARYRAGGPPYARSSSEPAVSYEPGVVVRRVDGGGRIALAGRSVRVGKGLAGEAVGLRPGPVDGTWTVWYGSQEVWAVSLRAPP